MDIFGNDKYSVSYQLAAAAALRVETESTLSNVTSLQSQSLYDSEINNQQIINQYNRKIDDEHIVVVHNNNSSHKTLQKKSSSSALHQTPIALVKSTKDIVENNFTNNTTNTTNNLLLHKMRSMNAVGGGGAGGVGGIVGLGSNNTSPIINPNNDNEFHMYDGTVPPPNFGGIMNINTTTTNTTNVVNNSKTATILVSKTKTKTGLPLLLKNSINN